MDKMKGRKDILEEHKLYGSMTVSPKGQVVIPASARKELGINSGDTLLLFSAPRLPGVVLLKADAVEQMLTMMSEHVTKLEKQFKRYKSSEVAKRKKRVD